MTNILARSGDSEIIKQLPDWLQEKFSAIQVLAGVEREQLEKERVERDRLLALAEEKDRELELLAHQPMSPAASESSSTSNARTGRRSSMLRL